MLLHKFQLIKPIRQNEKKAATTDDKTSNPAADVIANVDAHNIKPDKWKC